MAYGKRSNYRRGAQQNAGPRPNTYPGTCASCGQYVAVGAGILTGTRNTGYTTKHTPATLHGSPISGGYINGCPAETDELNAGLGHVDNSYVRNMARNLAAASDNPIREMSRRAGGKYAYTSSGARMTMSSQRCEDAPCCGCCD